MHQPYLGNLLLCVWSDPACFSKVYVRCLEIVQWALCVGEGGGEDEGEEKEGEEGGENGRERDRGGGREEERERAREFLTNNSSVMFIDE